jgi:hypothetical protein
LPTFLVFFVIVAPRELLAVARTAGPFAAARFRAEASTGARVLPMVRGKPNTAGD